MILRALRRVRHRLVLLVHVGLTAMAELTAIGVYVRFWLPWVPQWLPPLVALVVLYGANLVAVRVFGEMEFWFALIKIVTILALIVAGLAVIFFILATLARMRASATSGRMAASRRSACWACC